MNINIELPDILCPLCGRDMIPQSVLCLAGVVNAEVTYICHSDNSKLIINNVVMKVN